MKRWSIYALIVAILLVAMCAFLGAPSRRWASIEPGMDERQIVANLGPPTNNLLNSKGIQIWQNDGMIRTSSLAVLYYDPQRPQIATQTMKSDVWIWDRIRNNQK
jgi:hypothetical protein